MIVAIRMSGRVGVAPDRVAVLNSIRLRKKYACVLFRDKGILKIVQDKISYGEIDKETLALLISKRGRKPGNHPIQESAEVIIKKLEEGKSLEELGLKPFFSLQPPRGGFKKSTKLLYPRGVLGENKNINDLVRRML
jgi:large subunit ribosomal protein L30